jgi:hypothetical protein
MLRFRPAARLLVPDPVGLDGLMELLLGGGVPVPGCQGARPVRLAWDA